MVVRLVKDCEPLVALLPVHAPDAVHDVALVLDHVSVEDPLYATDVELALKVDVGGAAATTRVTLWLALPPEPVHDKV